MYIQYRLRINLTARTGDAHEVILQQEYRNSTVFVFFKNNIYILQKTLASFQRGWVHSGIELFFSIVKKKKKNHYDI